jgi:hypothetical protein
MLRAAFQITTNRIHSCAKCRHIFIFLFLDNTDGPINEEDLRSININPLNFFPQINNLQIYQNTHFPNIDPDQMTYEVFIEYLNKRNFCNLERLSVLSTKVYQRNR